MLNDVIERDLNGIQLKIALDGNYSITMPGAKLSNCASGVSCNGSNSLKSIDWSLREESKEVLILDGINDCGKWQMEFLAAKNLGGENGIRISFSGQLFEPVSDLLVVPMHLPKLSASHILTQGIAMGSCESILLPTKKAVSGHYQTMITSEGHTLQIAFPLMQKQPGKFTAKVEGNELLDVRAGYIVKHFERKEISLDPISIFCSPNGFGLMTDYGSDNVEMAKDIGTPVVAGWNSWDYYRWTISEDEVLKNAEFIARDPVLSRHVRRIIVDDGWQYCYGEWEANPLFPSGMAYLARELKNMGFIPGLWFAPAIVESHARMAQLDIDMLAMGESGEACMSFECMARRAFILDPTVPKSKKYLRELFLRYVEMGYEYFKLDFLGSALTARKFHDRTIPRSQIVGKIVEPIREALNGRAMILGCNYNFEAGNALVDEVRVGGDIHATWEAIAQNTISVAARFWSNGQLWVNDPDFALCRSPDTSDDPDLTRLRCAIVAITADMTNADAAANYTLVDDVLRPQMEVLLSVALSAGGAINLSDNLPRLNRSGLDLARRVVSAESGNAAVPLDLFSSERPSFWLQRVGDNYRLLIINWKDISCTRRFNLRLHNIDAKTAVNFWSDAVIPIDDGMITEELQPRSCLFVVIANWSTVNSSGSEQI